MTGRHAKIPSTSLGSGLAWFRMWEARTQTSEDPDEEFGPAEVQQGRDAMEQP